MNSSESYQVFIRFVSERHNDLISSLDDLVKSLVTVNSSGKKENAESSFKKSKDLESATAEGDRPSWVSDVTLALQRYIKGVHDSHQLITYLVDNMAIIKNHKWVFGDPSEDAFDFDSIFEHYKSQSRLPELFEEIIKILEELKSSDELDSRLMVKGLGKVISTLKKSKDGSYFSVNGAWEFLVTFLQNYMWSELSKIPALGSVMQALEKTIKETNEEMFKVHSNVQTEMENSIESDIKALKNKTSFDFISYNKSGLKLTNKNESLMLDKKV
ncbi:hypothetical protein ACM9HF_02300 [Colwellia sp. RE-S-Sl-9]